MPYDTRRWGKSFFVDEECETLENGEEVCSGYLRNFFMSELAKNARYALPFIKNIRQFVTPFCVEMTGADDNDLLN